MQPELTINRADFRFDFGQAGMRHRDRSATALELLQPEIEEFIELGKVRAKIVILQT